MYFVVLLIFHLCVVGSEGADDSIELFERRRPDKQMDVCVALDETLFETMLSLMRSQLTASNLYFQDIRSDLTDLKNELAELKEVQKETQIKRKTGELIPAERVQQSSTGYHRTTADKAVDGNIHTQSHTAVGRNLWYRYRFAGPEKVGTVKIINGKIDAVYYARLNGLRVVVMVSEVQRVACQPDSLTTREGEGVDAQTYYVDCGGVEGVGVEFNLDTTTALGAYLELREIEVYAA